MYLPESVFRMVRAGDSVEVSATEFPGLTSTGKVDFMSPIVDAASGSVQVIVRVTPDKGRLLRPGMAVRITFAGAARR